MLILLKWWKNLRDFGISESNTNTWQFSRLVCNNPSIQKQQETKQITPYWKTVSKCVWHERARRKSRLVMHEALVVELLEKKKVKKSDEGLGASQSVLRVKLTAKNSSQTLQLHLKSQHMRAGKWHDCGEQQHIPSDPYVEILKGDIILLIVTTPT